jgi:heme-degrading monooxygenase HmoA
MFIAMNRFQVRHGHETEFQDVWKNRDSRLKDVPGFVEFSLLRGQENETYTLFSSHTIWASRDAFEAWTKSEAFKDAHRSAGSHRHMYLDGPHFEGFDVVQHLA